MKKTQTANTKTKAPRKKRITVARKPSDLQLAKQVFAIMYPNFEFSLDSLFKELITERAVKLGLIKQEHSDVIGYAQVIFGIDSLNKALEKFLIQYPKPGMTVTTSGYVQALPMPVVGETNWVNPNTPFNATTITIPRNNDARLDEIIADMPSASDVDSTREINDAIEQALNQL